MLGPEARAELPTPQAQGAHSPALSQERCLPSHRAVAVGVGGGLALLWTPGKLERSPDGPRLPTAHR